ncbi:hypothetical protein MSKU9_3491 [Komagataeibacter diospyri]|uniref:Uncharacterized protein n=1 Tax=Komagataeibacter diospyri TaxID=1932662 RepID=A0A4P5NU68_9PROT|nr:hypothetical protein MSKU9_3491 [Komagataeibacter diospyri]
MKSKSMSAISMDIAKENEAGALPESGRLRPAETTSPCPCRHDPQRRTSDADVEQDYFPGNIVVKTRNFH